MLTNADTTPLSDHASVAGAAAIFPLLSLALCSGGDARETAVRFMQYSQHLFAPEYAVEDLLRAEGFADIRFVDVASAAEVPRQ